MCEKIREGKVLSPSSDGDIDEGHPTDWKPIKKTKKKKRSKSKVCLTCGQNIVKNKKRGAFTYKDTYHQSRAKEYCKNHETTYGDHSCKPHWCGDCGYLTKYQVEIQKGK